MGPSSPLEYHPTPHLIGIIVFAVFPLIYLTGRLTAGTLSLAFSVLRFMIISFFDFLYSEPDDEYERATVAVADSCCDSESEIFLEDESEASVDHESEAEDVVTNGVQLTNGLHNKSHKDGQPSSEEDSVDSGMGVMQSTLTSNGVEANGVTMSPSKKKHRRWAKKRRAP